MIFDLSKRRLVFRIIFISIFGYFIFVLIVLPFVSAALFATDVEQFLNIRFGAEIRKEDSRAPRYIPLFGDIAGYWILLKPKVAPLPPIGSTVIDLDEADKDFFIKLLNKQWPRLSSEEWQSYNFSRGPVELTDGYICTDSNCEFYLLDGKMRAFLMVIEN